MMHYKEEEGLNPSHQIYLAGCNLSCEFCSVTEWNESLGQLKGFEVEELIAKINERRKMGSKTLNLLGGEPAVNVYGILKLLRQLDPAICVVWNSNMYYNDIVDELLQGLISVYLADFKCGNNNCAESLLGYGNYVETIKENIIKACKQTDVIVRHIVLPGHFECCVKPIFKWLAGLPDIKLSLKGDYIPPAGASVAPKQYINEKEMGTLIETATEMGLRLIK
jgi:putative pyruvate formate lyase activating enzyme